MLFANFREDKLKALVLQSCYTNRLFAGTKQDLSFFVTPLWLQYLSAAEPA
jgi:hypothetical protein